MGTLFIKLKELPWERLGVGALLGWCSSETIEALHIDVLFLGFKHYGIGLAVAGAIVGLTRARKLLWLFTVLLFVGLLIVSYSPLARVMMNDLREDDSLQSSDAVVVLASSYLNDSTITGHSQDRLLHGMALHQAGYSQYFVLTRPYGEAAAWPKLAQKEMDDLGIELTIEEVGPVHNTHDEALAVAELAREKKWNRIILVTHSWHMRRAKGLFERAGVSVLCSSCPDHKVDLVSLDSPDARLSVFGYWLHEKIGYWVSRYKGWI